MGVHYPKRKSLVKRRRQHGFRAKMKSRHGRKSINRRRRRGQKINVRNL